MSRTAAAVRVTVLLALVCVLVAGAGSAVAGGSAGARGVSAIRSVAATAPLPGQGGTLRVAIGQPAYIDPYNGQTTEDLKVISAIYKPLTRVDPLDARHIEPAAALTWESDASAKVWTFHLDPSATFSDGTSVTASDFLYAWNRIASTSTHNTITGNWDPSIISYLISRAQGYDAVQSGSANTLSGVTALDDYTLRVTLTSSYADFPWLVSHVDLSPVPHAEVENGVAYGGGTVPFGEMPIGNGEFKLTGPWNPNASLPQVLHLVRAHPSDSTLLAGLDFHMYETVNDEYAAFRAGAIDLSEILAGNLAAEKARSGVSANGYTADPGHQVLTGATDATYYLLLNVKGKLLKNANLRKAISLAINRRGISNAIYEGVRVPADSILPPALAGRAAQPGSDSHYNMSAAKKALQKAGHPGGRRLPVIEISYNTGGDHAAIMKRVQADLKKIGVRTKLKSAAFPTYLTRLDQKKYQIARLGWVADYPVMQNFLGSLFKSSSADNKSGYESATVDSLLSQANATVDNATRWSRFNKINATVQKADPVVPLFYYAHDDVASSRVHNLTYSAMYDIDYRDCWVDGDL